MYCGYYLGYDNGARVESCKKDFSNQLLKKQDFSKALGIEFANFGGMPWNKLYRTSIIKDNQLRFEPGIKIAEDTLFNTLYVLRANRIRMIDDRLYVYVESNSSITRNNLHAESESLCKVCEALGETLKEDYSSEEKEFLSNMYIMHASLCSMENVHFNKGFNLKEIKKQAKKYLWHFMHLDYIPRHVRYSYGTVLVFPHLLKSFIWLYRKIRGGYQNTL